MDERAFADLSKRIAAAASRRGVLAVLAAGIVAAATGGFGRTESAEAAFGYCHAPGTPCSRDKKCCSGTCKSDGTCGCKKKGAPCINRVGIACCSQRCRKGKCK